MTMTTLIPFDLEAAKKGAAIVTRDGRSAEFLGVDSSLQPSYVFWAMIAGESYRRAFTVKGEWLADRSHDEDLFMAEAPKQEAASDDSGHDDKVDAATFFGLLGANSNEAFRDKLIIELSLAMLPHGHTPENVMDAVDTIMKRRAAVPMA